MQHEVIEKQDLLTKDGLIAEEGWARHPVWKYDKKAAKANKWQIKEWDYYAVTNQKEGWTVCGTVSDLGYAALLSISFVDFNRKKFSQADEMRFFTFGKMALAPSSTENSTVGFDSKKVKLRFEKKGDKRYLRITAPLMKVPSGETGLDADLVLCQPEDMESMNIATSWAENRTAFYLNEKVNCMSTLGTVKLGNRTVTLDEGDAYGVLDWGRGRWTRTNTWFWGSGNGTVDGHSFGFNIGYGFSDRTPASENVIFYDGKAHKFDLVEFRLPEDGDFLKPWKFTSSDGRFEMDFIPAVDRYSNTDFIVIKSVQHQVFGYFTGKAVLDDGQVIQVKDFPAFAEKVFNHW